MSDVHCEDAAAEFSMIGWLDPDASHHERLHPWGCLCSQPLRSTVHKEANEVYVRRQFGRQLQDGSG